MTDSHVWVHETKPPHRSYPTARAGLEALKTLVDLKVDESHPVRDAAGRLLDVKYATETAPAATEAKKEATK